MPGSKVPAKLADVNSALSAEHHPDCYPSERTAALRYFRAALKKAGSPATAPPPKPSTGLAGVIAPHIDFRVSLAAHAAAFRPLLDEPLAERYLILGVGHRSPLEWNLDRRDYITPLGRAVCDRDLVGELAAPSQFAPAAHQGEHSIEFPLLFLQAIHELHPSPREVRFVPVLCGGMQAYVEGAGDWDGLDEFHALAGRLRKLFATHPPGDKLRVIVSIDGCHIGPRFQHPFAVTPTLLQAVESWEKELWAVAAAGDARLFLDWFRAQRNELYFDGVGALALLMAAGNFRLERTYYERWFTPRDTSAVTFSSGLVLR
jgi:predicted class III extradiol MEMO1 family dioxygenase